jgi:prepilin-type N-terminal cleavage/methylation domain-containing protein
LFIDGTSFGDHARADTEGVGTDRQVDPGFTLIELVVAMTILAVAIVSIVGLTNSSFRVAAGASTRSKAVSLATKEIEAVRAVPYPQLVTTPTSVQATNQTMNGVDYHVEKTVVPVTDGSVNNAYRRAVVSVTWKDGAGSHEVTQSTYVYPGGIGPAVTLASTTTSTTACTPSAPATLVATPPVDLTQATSVAELAWTYTGLTCPAETFVLQYSTNGFATSNEVTRTATSSVYHLTGLSAGTSYSFRVAARSAAGRTSSWSPVATLSTGVSTAPACTIGTLTITPSAINKKSASAGSGLESNPAVSLPSTGTCSGFKSVYQPTAATSVTTFLVASANGTYAATLSGTDIPWDVGKRYVDILDSSTNTKVASILLTVCANNVSRCS